MSSRTDSLISPCEVTRVLGESPKDTWARRAFPHLQAALLTGGVSYETYDIPGCSWPYFVVNTGAAYEIRLETQDSRQHVCRMGHHHVHLVPPGTSGTLTLRKLESGALERIFLAMDPAWIGRFADNHAGEVKPGSLRLFLGRDDKMLATALVALYRALQEPQPMNSLFVDSAVQFIAAAILRDYSEAVARRIPHPVSLQRMERIKELIHQSFAQDIQLSDLADEAGLSPFHFSRVFKETVGMPPRQYIIKQRMDEACRLLKESTYAIAAIAAMVGYESVSHFSSLFKRHTGMSPAGFRRS
ncbi:helix-turn-helix domain-containing protein [Oceanidesulfovibrio marinus]|uniref:HTH araC/xylS-type domain-containing protein n=1 Tax=Oceanidesulfovibrio marinus TaxID=370038 RepID=A0A6P1ZD41_9BACT|nr:AraC family transcriptional regulator [Oceanidesulfovibrio marinus]TVM31385.1 hypothetical protein DQK91_18490 [Oceanidesulfovibrio marinus]